MNIKMKLVKSTKGTHVYSNDQEDSAISTLYIKKVGLPKEPPESITVSVEWEDK